MTRLLFLLAPLLLLTACDLAEDGEDEEDASLGRAADIAALSGDAAAGEGLYADNCASCHGADGSGGDPGPGILGEDADEIVEAVLEGEDGMPSFADVLTDQEIADIVSHLGA